MNKLTYNFVEDQFSLRGYKLLSNEYKSNRIKLDYICSKGHFNGITYRDFQTGRGCKICGRKSAGQNKRLSFDKIETSFRKEGYNVLIPTDGYKNVEQILIFICPLGHEHKMSYNNWRSGFRCAKCHHEKLSLIFSGRGHPNWKGGLSFDNYCEAWKDKEYKKDIKERDGNKCLNPGCCKEDNRLVIHHIDYDKKNCKPSNLITVCSSCNSKANYSREWHESWYKALMVNRHKYKY